MNTKICAALAVVVASAGIANADILFGDPSFDLDVWGTETVNTGGSFAVSQSLTTGNGALCRHVDLNTGPNNGDTIGVFHRYGTTQATRYEPMLQGAIASVSLQMDVKLVSTSVETSFPEIFLAAKQGQNVFYVPAGWSIASSSWTEVLRTNILAADFVRADGQAGSMDFSSTGAPIRFGFLTRQANAGAGVSSSSEFDNWCVNVTSVPAPGAMVLAGIGGLLAARRRRVTA